MLEIWYGLNNNPKLRRYIWKYNDVFKILKLTWRFWIDDKIVDIKRWLVFEDGDRVFWDYLDSTHIPVEKVFWKNWLNCIKFILNNWKEVTVAELLNSTQKLPDWIHSIESYVKDLDVFWDPYAPNSYKNRVYNILWEIRVAEHEYFSSIGSQTEQKKAELIKLLYDKRG